MNKNKEGYPDPTAGKAIQRADRPPAVIDWMVKVFKEVAEKMGYEIT